MTTEIKALDVVELLEDHVEALLLTGMRGTVLEVHNQGEAFLVEFTDQLGQEIAMLTLSPDEVKLVWQAATHTYVSAIDQLAEEVYTLTEEQAEELLTLVRNLRQTAA